MAFRRGMFDGAVSISAVQWLCYATKQGDAPAKRLSKFFRGLFAVLAGGARAVLQFYPEQPEHVTPEGFEPPGFAPAAGACTADSSDSHPKGWALE